MLFSSLTSLILLPTPLFSPLSYPIFPIHQAAEACCAAIGTHSLVRETLDLLIPRVKGEVPGGDTFTQRKYWLKFCQYLDFVYVSLSLFCSCALNLLNYSVYLSLYLSQSLSIHLSLSAFLFLSPSLFPSFSLSLYIYIYMYIYIALDFSLSCSRSRFHSLPNSLSLFLCFFTSLSLFFFSIKSFGCEGTSALRLLTHIIKGFPKNVEHQALIGSESTELGSSISVILTDPKL